MYILFLNQGTDCNPIVTMHFRHTSAQHCLTIITSDWLFLYLTSIIIIIINSAVGVSVLKS